MDLIIYTQSGVNFSVYKFTKISYWLAGTFHEDTEDFSKFQMYPGVTFNFIGKNQVSLSSDDILAITASPRAV